MLPWKRQRAAAAEAHRRAQAASQERHAAEVINKVAESLVAHSNSITQSVLREAGKNHWTELFTESMARRSS